MADYPNTVVHVDTPRPGPKRRINIRLHPESRNRRWGPRVQKLSTVPPPLVDWSSDDQTDGLCKGANVKKENAKSFSDIFGALQDESLKDETSTDSKIELNRDALRSHDDEGDGERASESDEDSSSSKRSREEMEDGLEEDTANQLKRTRMEGENGDLNNQYSVERNEKSTKSGSGDCKERTLSKKAAMSSTNQDASKGGESTGRESTIVGCQEKAHEVENDSEPRKLNPRAQEIRIHKALKKQVADKMQIPRPLDGVGKIQEGDTDSTEESEEEKENWKKVVESLTTNVGELEPVQSLSNQLKQSICSPPTGSLQDQPVFMHPWGLFPFRPIGPYSSCPPCWIPPPVFYPYAQPVPYPQPVRVPPGMQLSPSCSASPSELSNAKAPHTDNSECKTMASTPGYCHSNSSKVLNYSAGERTPIEATARQHQSLSDAEGVEEVRDERRQNNTTLPETPSLPPSRRKVYVPGKITQMKDRKCDFSRPLKEEDVTGKKREANSYISLMNQESSVSLYSPTTSEKCPKSSLNDDRVSPRDSNDQVIEEKDSIPWQRSWRGGQALLKAVQSSAPPAISTAKRSDPASFSDCLRGSTQWETSRNNAFTPGSSWANSPRAQLVARIQPRRRLTLQEEVMMNSTPKSFHQHFGVPASSSETLETDVVYPWSNVEYVDTHCHIDFLYQRLGCNGTFEKFGRVRGFPDNYGGCVAVFCTPESFHPTSELWQNLLKENKIWAAFGCHPHHVKNYDGNVETHILKGMMHNKAVAFGEIGLDYSNRNSSDHVLQHMVFRRQLALALQLQKPLVIHSREAESDTLDIMVSMVPKDYKIHRHCFTGPPEDARTFLKAFPNSFIGITNLVTFPSAFETHRTAQAIPLDKLLLETDAPYFLPRQCPREIRWSHPAMAVFVAEKIARLKGITINKVLTAVRKNTREMYGI